MFMPFSILGMWLRSLFALILIGAGIYLLTEWYNHRETVHVVETPAPQSRAANGNSAEPSTQATRTTVTWHFGLNWETAFLLGGIGLIGWSLGGGWSYPRLFRRAGADEPRSETAGDVERVRLADGTSLRVESCGPVDGDPVVMTHGWGLDKDEWYYSKKLLSNRFRVITWDLPGLGESDRPADRDWNLEKLAAILSVVISKAGDKPVALMGHSIGTMITLTYCKLYPQSLGSRIRSLVLSHGTYTNPVKTTKRATLYSALQKPVLEPLCHLMIWLSPLFRVMNWLSYLNGSAHRSTERDSFSGHETRGQLDFITRYYVTAAPDVVASGMLAMLRYDATDTLAKIPIPTLIVTGDKDETCLPDASRHMAKTIPYAELCMLKDAKHCGLFEHHQEFNEAVGDFLATPEGVGAEMPRYPAGAVDSPIAL